MRYKIGLFCDLEYWVLGTRAKQIARHLSHLYDFHICSLPRIYTRPLAELRALASCSAIHWISPYGYRCFRALFPSKPQIRSIFHCLEGDSHVPGDHEYIKVVTMAIKTRDILHQRGFGDVEIIHFGVDPELFEPRAKHICRQKLNLNNSSHPLIGFFGSSSSNKRDRKGTNVFINVLKQLNQAQQMDVLLSGSGWDELIQSLREAGIAVFHRPVESLEEMPWLYGAIDLYLCTSRVEGGPLPVLEAMACERPVVSTPVGHVPEVLVDGINGILVPIDDVATTVNAVQAALNDTALAQTMSRAGRQTILDNWTWETVIQPLVPVYQSAVQAQEPLYQRPHRRQYVEALGKLLVRSWRYYRARHSGTSG